MGGLPRLLNLPTRVDTFGLDVVGLGGHEGWLCRLREERIAKRRIREFRATWEQLLSAPPGPKARAALVESICGAARQQLADRAGRFMGDLFNPSLRRWSSLGDLGRVGLPAMGDAAALALPEVKKALLRASAELRLPGEVEDDERAAGLKELEAKIEAQEATLADERFLVDEGGRPRFAFHPATGKPQRNPDADKWTRLAERMEQLLPVMRDYPDPNGHALSEVGKTVAAGMVTIEGQPWSALRGKRGGDLYDPQPREVK